MIARFKKQEPTAEILSPIFPPELKYVTTLVRTIAASASRIYKPFIELTIQIRTNTRSKQAPRCHSKRTTKINHRSNRATMKNIKTILPTTKINSYQSIQSNISVRTHGMLLQNLNLKFHPPRTRSRNFESIK